MSADQATEQTPQQIAVDSDGFKAATRRGVVAAIVLAVLSIIEYYIADVMENPLWPLLPFVLLKAWVILDTFMHIRAVFRPDGDH